MIGLPAFRKSALRERKQARAKVVALERAIRAELEPVELPLEHHFIPGVYARKMFIPAGTVLVGKVHAQLHMCIVAKGRIKVTSEEGSKELEAGDIFVSEPGAKRAGFALEDTVFINIHTNEADDTDLAVLESKLITPEALEYTKMEVLK